MGRAIVFVLGGNTRMISSLTLLTVRLLMAAATVFMAHAASAQDDIGVLLMHGKQAAPDRPPALASLADLMQGKGMKVLRPRMPWAGDDWVRIAATVEAVHGQIDGYVAQLRSMGARRIVVAGHSIGANMALSYAVERGNVAGVALIAPGHAPAAYYRRMDDFRTAVDNALQLAESGQGSKPFSGPDNNQGRTFTIKTTAEVYLSWMSPRRLASMPAQAPRLSGGIPILMLIGDKDPAFGTAETMIYAPAAKHPHSKYVAISGDHADVIGKSGARIVEWLKGLPPP